MKLFLFILMVFGVELALAQSPSPSPSPAAVAVASKFSLSAFIGVIAGIVIGLNVVLSGVQKIFDALSKSEPGWLQRFSSMVLKGSQWASSNVNVGAQAPQQQSQSAQSSQQPPQA